MHLYLDYSVAAACLASAALDVEAEPSGVVAAHLGVGRLRENLSYKIEYSGICCRIAAGRSANGRLVDIDYLVELFQSQYGVMFAGTHVRPIELAQQGLLDNFVDEARFAGTGYSRYAGKNPERNIDVYVFEVVYPRALYGEHISRRLTPLLGDIDAPFAGEELTCHGLFDRDDLVYISRGDDLSAVLSRAGTYIDYIVGRPDGLLVVLDDY